MEEFTPQYDPNSPPFHLPTLSPADQINTQVASKESEEYKQTAEEYLKGWQRAKADYANLKKDMERWRSEDVKYAKAETVKRLLPLLDAFEKAMAHRPEKIDENMRPWVEGIGHIKTQLDAIMAAEGVAVIGQDDVSFDPSLHEPMMNQKKEGVASGTVIEILEPGYKLHDKVLRPAKVVVAE